MIARTLVFTSLVVSCAARGPSGAPSATTTTTQQIPTTTAQAPIEPARGDTMVVLPILLVGVSFPGRETASRQPTSLDKAIALRRSATNRYEEGERKWFFHGFDRTTLYFFLGRYHVRCNGLGCMDFVVDEIYAVPRSSDAARTLGVDAEIATYESGLAGVHAGMQESELVAKKGEPLNRSAEQLVGVSWWTYPDVRVLVVNGEVKDVAPAR